MMKHFGRASASALYASLIAAVFFIAIRGDAAELVKTIKSGTQALVTWSGVEGTAAGVEIPAGLLTTQKDPAHGAELWISDGTPSGTRLLLDINPGTESSDPLLFVRVGNVAVFQANDGIHGRELWRSDGTDAGTYMLGDIGPGKQWFGTPPVFAGAVLDGILYFEADDGVSGSELWRTDGTREGTFLAADIVPGYAGSGPADLTVAGNRLYFRESDGLWMSDGTGAGTQKIANVVVRQCCVAAGNAVFFTANDGVHGDELWRAVGQTAAMVANLNTESVGGGQDGSSYPEFVYPRSDSVIFIAQTPNTAPDATTAYDCKLYGASASGGGAIALANFHEHCSFGKVINLPGGMMFSVVSSDPPGPGRRDELWITDGTPAGTMPLDLNGLNYSTVLLNDNHFMPAYGPNGEAYFFGTQGAGQPDKVWRTDGTRAGTRVFADLATNSSVQEVAWFNGRVYFDVGGNTPIPQTGLWTSDGTPVGTTTVRVGDISNISDLRVAHGRLLFWSATADPNRRELWTSDGTSNGTIYLGKRSEAANSSVDANVVFAGQLGSRALFAAQLDSFALNRELSITDGTNANTSLVRDINIGGSSDPENFLTLGDQILFVAHDFDHAQELWRTDGTGSGTFQLQDIVRQGSDAHVTLGGSDSIINGVAYFTAGEDAAYPELWRTDGTVAGTTRITNVAALSFTVLGGNGSRLLFRAFSVAIGNTTHLWSWDGSQAQIITVADALKISSDAGVSFGGRACFHAWDVDSRYLDVWCASGAQGDLVRATNLAALGLSTGGMHALGNKLLVNVLGSGATSGLYFTQGAASTAQKISGERIKSATATAFGNGQLLFLSESGMLMLTDGTSAGTRNLLQGATLPGPISGAFGVLGSYVVFVVNDPVRGAVLWRTDGTADGARYVADLDPATSPASAQEASFFTLGNRLLYSGYRTNIGNEIWSLNATDPNASNDTVAATAGNAISVPVLDNDADFDGTLNAGSVSIVTQPAHGTAVVNATTGAISYTANTTYNGADELVYRVADNQGIVSNSASLSIQVTGGVAAPPPSTPSPAPSGGGGGGGGALGLEVLALALLAFRRSARV